MPKDSFREAFLHYIWQHQKFNKEDLLTTDGERISILSPGFVNKNAGPDFYQARLLLDQIEWHGTIEIHYRTSDWEKHSHATDKAYNNVILHLVWEHDKKALRPDGSEMPTLELKSRVDKALIENYKKLIENKNPIPCSGLAQTVDDIYIVSMLEKCSLERIESKAGEILGLFHNNKNDWEETCFQWLGKCFGFKINSEPLQRLCSLLPYAIVKKYHHKPLQMEALVFGVAGFLDDGIEDSYFQSIKTEFAYLKQKHSIAHTLDKSEWNFLRLRPANFPTIRLAQFASFLVEQKSVTDFVLFESLTLAHSTNKLATKPNPFWKNHFHFNNTASTKSSMSLGNESIESIIANAIVPLRFAHSMYLNNEEAKEDALSFLKELKAEKNSTISNYSLFGLKQITAFESQALIQLYNFYCSKKNCLSCSIGNQVLQLNA